jgi:phosphate-selective porin OprO/OprP
MWTKFEQGRYGVNPDVRVILRSLFVAGLLVELSGSAAAQQPSVTAGDWLRVDFRARFQGDVRRSEAPIDEDESGLDIARRRVGIEGHVRHVIEYQVEYELGLKEWRDVYVDYRQFKALQVKAGAFKLPFGLEENTSSTSLDFIYRARISSRLAPGRDRGLTVHGRVLKNVIAYEAGVFRHDGDNARPSASARVFGGPTVAARVVAAPFRESKSAFEHLQFGGAIATTDIPLGFPAIRARTVFGASFYDSRVWVQGQRQRAGLEARWRAGRVALQTEYIRLSDERRGQSVEDSDLSPLVAQGWYAQATYVLTRGRNRREPPAPKRGSANAGVFEVAARYETLRFGSNGSAGEPSTSARADSVLGNSERAITVGVNWKLNRWVKVQGNLIREDFERPSLGPWPAHSGFWSRAFRLQLTL